MTEVKRTKEELIQSILHEAKEEGREDIEITIAPDGSIHSNWWTPQIAELLCELCSAEESKCEKDGVGICVVSNPWCG